MEALARGLPNLGRVAVILVAHPRRVPSQDRPWLPQSVGSADEALSRSIVTYGAVPTSENRRCSAARMSRWASCARGVDASQARRRPVPA